MAITCLKCGNENPNAAKFCMFCSTQLVEESQLSEDDKLRIQLAETMKQLEALNKQDTEKELTYKQELSQEQESSHPYEQNLSGNSNIEILRDYPNKGDYYEGEVKNNVPNGKGIIFYQNGDWEEGCFENACLYGIGTYYNAEYKRKDTGEHKYGTRTGTGKMEWENGNWYFGEWNDNGAHGNGEYHFEDGSWSKGYYVDGSLKKGTYYYENGNYEEGGFDEDGNLHGFGVFYDVKYKRKDTGEYRHGKRHGKGKIEFIETGKILEGEWNDDGIIEGSETNREGNMIEIKRKSTIIFDCCKELYKCLRQEHTEDELWKAVNYFLCNTITIDNVVYEDEKLIMALVEYLFNEAQEDEQNLFMVADLINFGIKREGQEEYGSDLDRLFDLLEEKDTNHIAVQYHKDFLVMAKGKKYDSLIRYCRNRFSAIGSAENLFEYTKDATDIDVLANLIMLSFSENPKESDTNKLTKYLFELYDDSQKTGKIVKAKNLLIDMVEVKKLRNLWYVYFEDELIDMTDSELKKVCGIFGIDFIDTAQAIEDILNTQE